jgi:hypothetical protein
LFLDHSVAEAAGGRIAGGSLGHFGPVTATPDVSNASIVHGYCLSSKQNHSGIDFGCYVKENVPSAYDLSMLATVLNCQHRTVIVKTAPPGAIWLCC